MTMTFTCTSCGRQHEIEIYPKIDARANPELTERLRTGELFIWKCPACDKSNLALYPLVFTSTELSLLLCLSPQELSSSGEVPGFNTARQVASVGEFVEKLKIFEAGLDDIGVEMCKFIAVREMEGRTAEGESAPEAQALRFTSLEGADNFLIFSYPADGTMRMLRVGLNVYEDCMGIVSRNPALRENAAGLSRIDQAWVGGFFE